MDKIAQAFQQWGVVLELEVFEHCPASVRAVSSLEIPRPVCPGSVVLQTVRLYRVDVVVPNLGIRIGAFAPPGILHDEVVRRTLSAWLSCAPKIIERLDAKGIDQLGGG